jgi:hypothetical protein
MELNTSVGLPESEHKREEMKSVLALNFPTVLRIRLDKLHSKYTVVQDFINKIMAHKTKIELNHTVPLSRES